MPIDSPLPGAVLANGVQVPPLATARAGDNITVQATPVQAGLAVGATMTTPYLRVHAKQRGPTTPQQQADPLFGDWLDV